MLFNTAKPGIGRVQVLGIKKMEEELLEKSLELGWGIKACSIVRGVPRLGVSTHKTPQTRTRGTQIRGNKARPRGLQTWGIHRGPQTSTRDIQMRSAQKGLAQTWEGSPDLGSADPGSPNQCLMVPSLKVIKRLKSFFSITPFRHYITNQLGRIQ